MADAAVSDGAAGVGAVSVTVACDGAVAAAATDAVAGTCVAGGVAIGVGVCVGGAALAGVGAAAGAGGATAGAGADSAWRDVIAELAGTPSTMRAHLSPKTTPTSRRNV